MENSIKNNIVIPKASWENMYEMSIVQKNIPSNIYSFVDSEKFDVNKISFLLKYYSKNTDYLNYFIRDISIAIMKGSKFSFFNTEDSEKSKMFKNNELAFYYTNENPNIAVAISDEQLCKFLTKGPSLTVSKEGVLIFNTKTELLFTINCCSSVIVKVSTLAKEFKQNSLKEISFTYTVGLFSNNVKFSNGDEYEIVFDNINFFTGIPTYKFIKK